MPRKAASSQNGNHDLKIKVAQLEKDIQTILDSNLKVAQALDRNTEAQNKLTNEFSVMKNIIQEYQDKDIPERMAVNESKIESLKQEMAKDTSTWKTWIGIILSLAALAVSILVK